METLRKKIVREFLKVNFVDDDIRHIDNIAGIGNAGDNDSTTGGNIWVFGTKRFCSP